jgi:hypothetical protein
MTVILVNIHSEVHYKDWIYLNGSKVYESIHRCKILSKVRLYIYVHLLVSLLCHVICSMHGYGLFKIKRMNLADHIVNRASFFYLCTVNDYAVCNFLKILER